MLSEILSMEEWQALRLSLFIGSLSVVCSLPFGIGLGYLLARKRFWGIAAVETVVNFSLVMPPVVVGLGLLIIFGPESGLIGRWLNKWFGLSIPFTMLAAILAAAVVSFPLMVRSIRLAFQGVDPRLEQAARSLGAGPLGAFLTVSLPLAINGVIAGSVLAFARSLGEFGATVMFAGNVAGKTQTLSLAIFSFSERPGIQGETQMWRLAFISALLAASALGLSEYLEHRAGRV